MSDEKADLATLRIDRRAPASGSGKVRVAVLIAAAVLVLVAAGWGWARLSAAPEVEVAAARPAGISSSAVLNASGYVTARRKATVAAKITGRLVDVRIEEGMPVAKDQVLALLDDSEWRAQLEVARAERDVAVRSVGEAEASLAEARSTLRRTRELAASGFTSEQELERADTGAKVWEARLRLAREQVTAAERRIEQAQQGLDNCTVRAPFGGVAISKDAQVGEMVSPVSAGGGFTRTGISTIVDMGSLEIEVDVNEAYIARVTPGQAVVASLDAYPEWRIPAKVITTIPAADRQRATVRVRIAFDELDPRILPDMGVKVAFLEADQGGAAQAAPRALVPKEAIRGAAAAPMVWVVAGDRVERRAVTTGMTGGPDIPILAGLEAGEVVVIRGGEGLSDGQRVRVKRRAGAS